MAKTDKTLEKSVENYLCQEVKKHGGKCLKQNPAWRIGVPDRIVILPCAVYFVELKRFKGGRLSAMQEKWRDDLQALYHDWRVIKSKAEVDELIEEWKNDHRP